MADVISCQSDKRMRWCSVPERVQLHMAMLALQFGYAGFHVVSRFALNMGISKIVFIVYRNIIAFLLLAPFAYFLEKKDRPKITINFLIQFFFLALVGITANQSFYMLGLENTSPTFASAIQNSVPAITFLMAVILRIEKVRLDRKDGLAKVFGTVFCVAGASVITLFKGPPVYTPRPPLQATGVDLLSFIGQTLGSEEGKNWTLGCMFLIGHCLSWSGWLVLQAPVLKKYPARLSVTSYTCFFGLIQFLVISAFIERDPNAWIVRSGGEVFSIFYAGVVASGIAFAVQIWCIDRGGPVFVAVYQPVQTLVVAIMASVALGEEFYLGGLVIVPLLNLLLILSFISVRWLRTLLLTGSDRIIGAALIVVGLYLVLWGKNEERKYAIEKATILSDPNHVCDAEPSLIKPTLTRPLLPPSTENV